MRRELAIDLGTATTRVWERGQGIVLREPTVVALDERSARVQALGTEAAAAIGRSSGSLVAERPLEGGAIQHLSSAVAFLTLLLARAGASRFSRPHVVIAVPAGLTSVEQRAVRSAATQAGVSSVALVAQSMAAAVGAGLPVDEPLGNVVIDVGAGTSEVAIISLGGPVAVTSVRVGGLDVDASIRRHLRDAHAVAIGERTAEELKLAIGSAVSEPAERKAVVRGRALATGVSKDVVVNAEELRVAIDRDVTAIAGALLDTLGQCPPELAQDITAAGAVLCGGGALLRGLDVRLARNAGISIRCATDPLDSVVIGAGAARANAGSGLQLLADR